MSLVLNVQGKTNEQQTKTTNLQYAEVNGVITNVNFSRDSKGTNFKIFCPKISKTFESICEFFCPLRVGDTIYAYCVFGVDGKLHVLKPPFVQPAIDKESVIQCFIKALKKGFRPVLSLYQTISIMAGGEEQVIPFLTAIAQQWNDTRDTELLFMFGQNASIDHDDVKKLLEWWHRERNVRRLYLFGLTKKEINACRMTCEDIYQKCMKNPYTIPAIPIEKADQILDRINQRPNPDDRYRGLIVRTIWKFLHESAWIGVPSGIIARHYPNIKEHVDALKLDYDVVPELGTAYLKFPHKVETFVADFIQKLVKADYIKYDTPLDQKITMEDGTVIERLSAHFTKQLSEDQMKSIQGALDHTCSIITGGAGVGKCLQIGTKILMADGTIKKIEEIQVGESVMGPDSYPRKVLSTCSGTDDLFEILPRKGKSFTCNTPHVLTLKGLVPSIERVQEKFKVVFSEKGIKKEKHCLTEKEAKQFVSGLKDDIFDIPLDEYMTRKSDQQENCYLFHTGVDFPEKDTPIDPYIIGYWLGDEDCFEPQINTGSDEILEYFKDHLKYYDAELVQNQNEMKYDIKAVNDENRFLTIIQDLNLTDIKYIPEIYKCNSRKNRLQLLAGLIDANGYVDPMAHNSIEIIQKNNQLADDIEYLAFSLGLMVTRSECTNCSWYQARNYYRMNIFGSGIEEIPSMSIRKILNLENIDKRATCQNFEVIPKGKGIYCGFELDGDGRFLLSDFLVTHNTTVLGQIIHNLEMRGITYAVTSFTGKAVARIREVTKKRNPSTIHRLISNSRKNKLDKRSTQFEKDIPLMDYEHILIDETSMVTEELFYDLIQAYPNVKKITFLGDSNQLNPISFGNLFTQLLKSETIPTYRLTTNYRVYLANSSNERDGIILNANAIINYDPIMGQYEPFEFVPTSNFSVHEGGIERVYDIIKGCFGSGLKPEQLVVICPYNRYLETLNREFQKIYNSGSRSVTDSRGNLWRIGDRVMLLENDNEIGVFNGESGSIRDLTDKAILVDFGNSGCHEFLLEPTKEERYYYGQAQTQSYKYHGQSTEGVSDGDEGDRDDERTVKKLQLSYAITVDKSQGSEYDFVIVYIPEFSTGGFLNKNRIYTSITRSKRCCWCVVSDLDLFNQSAIKPQPFRCDNLAKRLVEKLPKIQPFVINKEDPRHAADDLKTEEINPDQYEPDFGYDPDDE